MKVLYLSGATGADYMADMLFHGLRTLLGADCVDVNKLEFMYQGWSHPPFYTVYSLLPDIEVNRGDIEHRISDKYFDLIIYGSVHRYRQYSSLVASRYPRNQVFLIDGEDDGNLSDLRCYGTYFKRELQVPDEDLHPIQFAIPKEKIIPAKLEIKERLMAHCDPRDRATYVYYGDEYKYYQQYATSYFGYTMKKGGWDCCRHYEIMAAGAIPYFANLDACPIRTLNWLPKRHLAAARDLYDSWGTGQDDPATWLELAEMMQEVLRRDLTTVALAKRILEYAP
jgi:hypothetical protein